MAQDVTGQPWIFNAEGQSHARDVASTRGNDNSLATRQRLRISQIKVDTGNGGDVLISDASGGRRLLKLDNTPQDDTLWVPIKETWAGLYVTTLPTNASLEVYHGYED